MQTPAHTERQALNAAIGAIGAIAGGTPDQIILTPVDLAPGDGAWVTDTNIFWSSTGRQMAHQYSRMRGNEYGIQWFGKVAMQDAAGRIWHREFNAVDGDFGDLVEVQPC